jgi:hypothetical protein
VPLTAKPAVKAGLLELRAAGVLARIPHNISSRCVWHVRVCDQIAQIAGYNSITRQTCCISRQTQHGSLCHSLATICFLTLCCVCARVITFKIQRRFDEHLKGLAPRESQSIKSCTTSSRHACSKQAAAYRKVSASHSCSSSSSMHCRIDVFGPGVLW